MARVLNRRRTRLTCVTLIMLASFGMTRGQDVPVQDERATPTPAPASEAERVIVTGSHIPTAEEVGPNPVVELNREVIEKSGERTAADLLRNLPIAGPGGVPTANNGAGLTPGASSIALRGFDASSTLVLLDGRRLAPYPLGTDNGAVTFVDLNSIPKAALDSIEILKDSASSIYGADAIAGVVNIKFRRNYRGAEFFSSYGNTLDKDSSEFTASLVFGAGDDKTDVTGVLNFYHRNSIFQRDRGFSSNVSFLSTNASPLNLQLSRDAVLAAGVSATQLPPPNRPLFGHAPFLTNGDARATDYIYTPFRAVGYNFNRDAGAVPDSERYGGFVTTSHKICDDQLVLYGDFFYQKVKTLYQIAPTATGNFQTPGNTTLAIPPHAPGPTVGGPSYDETGVPLGAFNPFNPFQQIISGGTRARLIEFGNRIIRNETDAFFSTLGLKGDKLFDDWGYDASFRYSEVQNISQNTVVSASRFNRILNAADPIFDPASSQFIGTTTPYNPFGDFRRPIPTNSLPVNFATVHPSEIDISKLTTVDLNVYTTSLFELPAGGVGLAFGGQFRRESLSQDPDQLLLDGDVAGAGPGNFTRAGKKAYAFYAEASVPIVSAANPIFGIRSLQFVGSARFEEFRNNDTNVLVPKVGMRWQPFDESLTIRATWGEGFHQPSLIELFGSPTQGINSGPVFDPVTRALAPEFPFIIRNNPNLQPEDSRAFTGGIVYTPKFLSNLTLAIDIYDIESTSRAFIPSFQNVIERAAAGKLLPLEAVHRDPNTGEIILLEEAFQNAGSRKARGADFGLSYQLDTRIGSFTSVTQVTFLDSLQFAQVPGEPETELRGTADFFFNTEAPLKWRGVSRLDYTWRGFSTGVTAYYLDGFHESVRSFNSNDHYVSQTWLFDVRASYTFNFVPPVIAPAESDGKKNVSPDVATTASFECADWRRFLNGTTLTIGCNNVFGQDPPRSFSTENYPSFLYDPTGRFVYFSLTKKF